MYIKGNILIMQIEVLQTFLVSSQFWPNEKIQFQQSTLWRRQWHPAPVLLPGKSCGWRSLVGYSPWGRQGRTERLHFRFSLSCIGEGNGTPLQYSCLENPRDRGAQWVALLWGCTESDTTEVTQQQQQQSTLTNYMVTEVQRYTELNVNKTKEA